ncbi:4-amino-4-deoxy-L-arabinose transferase [Nocardioides sp. MAH-18]|uniref:4-amino-4-deoxy-L-arabinose transferase n=1 Tax=Nocardioides agri TaxID=2682843 RepID=A0A6L6XL83_9ACTN|nr:4-amino-4-deoxy-L-arabinose transferase [Nocardioides sp. CGMCC 1.13656]MVQ47860.1 4-amino-4-deoxy-L-arabinose transferase [Nocardioides sp. MAH-18]
MLARPATLGAGRLLSIDGPSGSGKTTLASAVAGLVPDARVVHVDELVHGWDGLPDVAGRLDALLRPLATGRAGACLGYDWVAAAPGGEVVVEPASLVVVEGVGSGCLPIADLVTVLVWVEADLDVRMTRGLERDGETFRPHWEQWALAEQQHFAEHRSRERADLVVRT